MTKKRRSRKVYVEKVGEEEWDLISECEADDENVT